jgi:hypothetical protein
MKTSSYNRLNTGRVNISHAYHGPAVFLSTIMMALMTSCGTQTIAKGFVSDANICRPIDNSAEVPVDFSKGKLAVPAVTGGTIAIGQMTTPEVEKKYVWGFELLLSNTLTLASKMTISPLIKRSSPEGSELFSVGPDGATAMDPLFGGTDIVSQALTPTWVRGQLNSVITLDAGQSIWLVAKPTFDGEQSLAWWLTSGEGLYVAPPGVPAYANVPDVKALHRLVYCD